MTDETHDIIKQLAIKLRELNLEAEGIQILRPEEVENFRQMQLSPQKIKILNKMLECYIGFENLGIFFIWLRKVVISIGFIILGMYFLEKGKFADFIKGLL